MYPLERFFTRIQGIGENLYDFRLSEAEGQLKGIIYYPLPMYFHGALNSYSHEIGHHWINYLNFDPFNLGGGPHWPIGSLPRSIIGYNYPGGGQGLNYPWDLTLEGDGYRVSYNTTADDYFHDIDLYLMGLLPADEANSVFFIAENQYQTDQLTNGGFIEGPFINVDVDDIIDEFGPRIPGYPTSQKKFSVGTIVVSSKLLSIEEISLYNYYSKCAEAKNSMYVLDQWQNPFYVATNGFGEIDSSIYEYSPTSIPEEKTFDIPVNQDTYTVSTFSNSTVTTVVFNQTLKRLRFNVEGDAGTVGLCNITVPSELMSGDFSVCLDDVLLVEGVDYTESSNGTHYLFSIRYEHSSHILDIFSINVIPDFSNLLFLLFLFSATLLGFTLKKRLMQKKGNCG
jgi:hypothetical protein